MPSRRWSPPPSRWKASRSPRARPKSCSASTERGSPGAAVPEINFDGIVGPTHNYAGLSPGNVASLSHDGQAANPRRAALQGLSKMRLVASLGVGQAVLPPHERPRMRTLRQLGFRGSDEEVLARAASDPVTGDHALRLCSSAAAMWTANAATCIPASDSAAGRPHLVPP